MEKTGMRPNRKLIIGILPTINIYQNDNPYDDRYSFVNNYPKKVYAAGGIPIGLLLSDGIVEESLLELCDAFLWPGGSRIDKNLYRILYHSYKYKKPFLGICMGMQGMALFSVMDEEIKKNQLNFDNITSEQFQKIYQKMSEENPVLAILDRPNIHGHIITRDNIDTARHLITITKDSFLYQIYQKEIINVVSLHNVIVKRAGNFLQVTAQSEDSVVEAVEANDPSLFWVGVQYHPEIEEDNVLLNAFVEECYRRNNTSEE